MMKTKLDYNPAITTGSLYYMEPDIMLTFHYEYYKRNNVIAITIPIEFDENFRRRRDEILNFIGKEVAAMQLKPSYYKITNTSIEIRRTTPLRFLKALPIQVFLGTILLIAGIYMTRNGIILGKELQYATAFRKSMVPVYGPVVIIVAIAWLIIIYFNRKKN